MWKLSQAWSTPTRRAPEGAAAVLRSGAGRRIRAIEGTVPARFPKLEFHTASAHCRQTPTNNRCGSGIAQRRHSPRVRNSMAFGKPQGKTEQSNARVWAISNLQSGEPVAMCPESLAFPLIRFANIVSSCSAAAKSGLRRACLILAQRRSTDPRRQQSGCQASS